MLGATRVGPAFFTSILAANLPSLEKQQTNNTKLQHHSHLKPLEQQ